MELPVPVIDHLLEHWPVARLATLEQRTRGEEMRRAVLTRYIGDLETAQAELRDREREAHLQCRAAQTELQRLATGLQDLERRGDESTRRVAELTERATAEEGRLRVIEEEAAGLEASLREREEYVRRAEHGRREVDPLVHHRHDANPWDRLRCDEVDVGHRSIRRKSQGLGLVLSDCQS